LKLNPGGKVPAERLNVIGAVPPAGFVPLLYAAPTVPVSVTTVSVGSGFTVIVALLALVVPVTAAVNVTIICVVSPGTAVNTTLVPVVAESDPHVGAEPQLIVHETFGDPSSSALNGYDWPESMVTAEADSASISPPG
jgi:hypothetical protein